MNGNSTMLYLMYQMVNVERWEVQISFLSFFEHKRNILSDVCWILQNPLAKLNHFMIIIIMFYAHYKVSEEFYRNS